MTQGTVVRAVRAKVLRQQTVGQCSRNCKKADGAGAMCMFRSMEKEGLERGAGARSCGVLLYFKYSGKLPKGFDEVQGGLT